MPYTCAFINGYVGVAAVASRGALSLSCRVGGVTGCSRGWRARAVGHRGATAGRPGNARRRPAGWRRRRARARAAQRCFCSRRSVAPCRVASPRGDKRRKNHVSQICRPFCFRPQFLLSLLEGIQNERAR